MKEFFQNKWVKRSVAMFDLVYFAMITLLTVATFLYELEFDEGRRQQFFIGYVAASAFFFILMVYTREELITKILSMILLFVVFCLVLFNMYDWILIIPPFVVALLMFFISGANETVKVIMGTIYLLMYVLGLVAYFVFNLLFGGSSQLTELNSNLSTNAPEIYDTYKAQSAKINEMTSDDNAISPDGKYRIVLYDVQNSDKGGVYICVVPSGNDKKLKYFTLKEKGIRKTISNKGVRGVVPDVHWQYNKEKDTMEVLYILTPESKLKYSSVNDANMPEKQYLEFLGIS